MAESTLTVRLPDSLVALFSSPQVLESRLKQALVIDLLREGELSQGQAALLLDLSMRQLLDLMAHNHVPSGPTTISEVTPDVNALRSFFSESSAIDSDK